MKQNREDRSYRFQIRIMLVYCSLILLSFFGAVLAIRRVLLLRLDARVEQALHQEIQELRILVNGKDPETAQPFGDNITAIFNTFLRRNIPVSDEYTIALFPDRFYNSVPPELPPAIDRDSSIVKYWQKITLPVQGTINTSEGEIVYLAEPVKIEGRIKGIFVVAIAMNNPRQEVTEAILIIIRVTSVVVAITSILAWVFAGRILSPLRLLTETAQAIRENNLDRRIQVKGNDEVAQLGTTFNEMLDRLQSAFITQRQFLNDVGHELKTPITIVQGHLELMGDTPEEQQETKEIVLDELERMNRLLNDLMLLAKSERPDFLNLEPLEISTLTEEIYQKVRGMGDRQWQLETVAQGIILADRQRLAQAVVNLAQNATKHTLPEDTIAIGSSVEGNKVSLWVRDTGTGIAPADRQRIFERFQTGNNGYAGKSTGLGLSIVNAIVQAHSGRIELSSKLNHGSKFTIVLPQLLILKSSLSRIN
ncbi:MAG: HAMP domain-containing sensor histidine kinase [Pleurocapsa sp. MO_226.B13]|nr:HAMP domain-containing sensor histidine kinase [Pleurocapsa sp. MO_226.B13]